MQFTRRALLQALVTSLPLASISGSGDGWSRGAVRRVLPTSTLDAFNIKRSVEVEGELAVLPALGVCDRIARRTRQADGRSPLGVSYWWLRARHDVLPRTPGK